MKSERPLPGGPPTNFETESSASKAPRQHHASFLDSDSEPVGSILRRVLETLVEEPPAWSYAPCEECHRPSWSYVEWLLDQVREDERRRCRLDPERCADYLLDTYEQLQRTRDLETLRSESVRTGRRRLLPFAS